MDKFETETLNQFADLIDELQLCFLDGDAYSRAPSLQEWKTASRLTHRIKLLISELRGYVTACSQYKIVAFRNLQTEVFEQKENPDAGTSGTDSEKALLKFTAKEISRMPKFVRNLYKLKGGTFAHIRKKENGTYEIRYRRNGINLSVSSKNLECAKERFIEKLNALSTSAGNKNVTFAEFASTWLDVVKRPHVQSKTLDDYDRILKNYINPHVGNVAVKNIRPMELQKILSEQLENGNGRTATMIYTVLKPIFDFAVGEELISRSPMALIKKPKYEVQHGEALSLEEERALVKRLLSSESPLRFAFLFVLYTGIRRSELTTAEISDKWVVVVTAKARKGESKKKRKIPISPMLRPYLRKMTKKALSQDLATLTHEFPKFAPGHHLHDLRHTFITRCQECGIPREVVSLWAGHKADNTMTSNVYTHFSEEFQLKEAEKLTY